MLCTQEFDQNFEDLDISIGSFSLGKGLKWCQTMTSKKPYCTYPVKSIKSSVISLNKCQSGFQPSDFVNHFENDEMKKIGFKRTSISTKGLASFAQLVKAREGNLVLALPSIRFS